ncbi:hypothetical protein F2Q70_00035118 [Brassica cretica]|uniref:Glycylpeptide N-tetradecanoyltransferase n=1 Tax=Brassica cretica TaxID=69181 RepID=A0A8S9JYX9_BRACR|nr:hypothetical protein F2Q70_00035118 [Brassica cretica]
MGDENSLAGSLEEKADQVAEATPLAGDDASLETIVRRFQDSMSVEKTHKFWETQPVGQFKDIGDTSLPEGPIEAATPLSEVKQEPYNLPAAYEWTTCDMKSDYVCSEVYNLLKNNYVEDDENMFRFNYSKEFLSWALRPPGYYQSWHIGVRAKVSWLLPREDVVDSYLVESPETHDVTDFCSFYTLPSTILGNPNYSTLKAAYSYYNVATKTTFLQLMNDALIVAKQKGFDVFNALDVMHNESFLKELKFGPGDGQLHYYLYNYRLRSALKPSELGLVLL